MDIPENTLIPGLSSLAPHFRRLINLLSFLLSGIMILLYHHFLPFKNPLPLEILSFMIACIWVLMTRLLASVLEKMFADKVFIASLKLKINSFLMLVEKRSPIFVEHDLWLEWMERVDLTCSDSVRPVASRVIRHLQTYKQTGGVSYEKLQNDVKDFRELGRLL